MLKKAIKKAKANAPVIFGHELHKFAQITKNLKN
jgi:hypothetical protein